MHLCGSSLRCRQILQLRFLATILARPPPLSLTCWSRSTERIKQAKRSCLAEDYVWGRARRRMSPKLGDREGDLWLNGLEDNDWALIKLGFFLLYNLRIYITCQAGVVGGVGLWRGTSGRQRPPYFDPKGRSAPIFA